MPNMCPKSSRKTRGEVHDNKQNLNKSKKKTRGEIKHDKKLKKRAKLSNCESPVNNDNCQMASDIEHGNENGSDLDLSADSAFVQSIIEKSGIKVAGGNGDCEKPMKLSFTEAEIEDDYANGFCSVKKGKVAKSAINRTSEGFGAEAYKCILENKKEKGIALLNRAIALEQFDARHYFNRSYFELCVGQYQEALADIQFVINHTDNPIYLARMKCREGQIFKQMQKFDKAEECFEACLNLFPNSVTVRCEFMRMKIARLQAMGFPEDDIIALLYDNPYLTLREAVNFLVELSRFQPGQAPPSEIAYDENEEFQSDTEEDPSNTRLFMEMTNFNTYTKDDVWHRDFKDSSKSPPTPKAKARVAPPVPAHRPRKPINRPNSPASAKELRVINATGAKKAVPKTITGANVNAKGVCVGSVTSAMTEAILKRVFTSAFGPVASVCRAPDNACAVVNFDNVQSANMALEAESIKVFGKSLPIKLNKRGRLFK